MYLSFGWEHFTFFTSCALRIMFVLLMLLLHTGNNISSINMHIKVLLDYKKRQIWWIFWKMTLKTSVLIMPVFTSAFKKKFWWPVAKTVDLLLEVKVTHKFTVFPDLSILGKTLAKILLSCFGLMPVQVL